MRFSRVPKVALLGALFGTAASAAAPDAKEAPQIVLDQKQLGLVHHFKIAPRLPVTFEFPEAYEEPIRCGDCLSTAKGGAAPAPDKVYNLFRLDAFPAQHSITVKIIKNVGRQADGSTLHIDDFITNLSVRLPSYGTVKIELEGTTDPKQASEHVSFLAPGMDSAAALIKQQVELAKKECEAGVIPRLEAGISDAFLKTLLAEHRCDKLDSGPRTRRDLLILEIKEVCRFPGRLFIRFDVENREKDDPFEPEFVQVKAGSKKGQLAAVELRAKALSSPQVAFRKTASGIVEIADPDQSLAAFELRLAENGGRNREINLEFEH